MKKTDIIKFLLIRSVGNFLLLFALFGVGATFGPALYYEANFRLEQAQGIHYAVVASSAKVQKQANQATPDFTTVKNEKVIIPVNTEFGIVIPKIGANSKIIPNVDPNNETEYMAALQQGVAHAKGSVFPGMNGTIYLFAHSTDNFWDVGRYNAVFYLLKDLSVGDEVAIFFQQKRYNYQVTGSKIVDPSDTSYLVNAQLYLSQPSSRQHETLIMQTCWPPGTTWKRLLVFAKPK